MKLRTIAFLLVSASLSVTAMGQSLSGRVFSYDGSNFTNGSVAFVVNGDGHGASVWSGLNPGAVAGQNDVKHAHADRAEFLAGTLINVETYVYISGNFGGVYTVNGFGAASDTTTYSTDVEIRTNRSLMFSTDGFYGISRNIGSIAYEMRLFEDYPSNGVQIGPTLIGTDHRFNGNSVYLNARHHLPADGKATLRLSRTLTLTQKAIGGQQYTAGGYIQVGVN